MPKSQPRAQRYEHFIDGDFRVIQLGSMDIWDGGTMALFRDITHNLMKERQWHIGLDISGVQYLPEGFFGHLFNLQEAGAKIRLYAPTPRVRRMFWFRMFFERPEESNFGSCFKMVRSDHAPTYGDLMMISFNEEDITNEGPEIAGVEEDGAGKEETDDVDAM